VRTTKEELPKEDTNKSWMKAHETRREGDEKVTRSEGKGSGKGGDNKTHSEIVSEELSGEEVGKTEGDTK
jgi:hypothetical protein